MAAAYSRGAGAVAGRRHAACPDKELAGTGGLVSGEVGSGTAWDLGRPESQCSWDAATAEASVSEAGMAAGGCRPARSGAGPACLERRALGGEGSGAERDWGVPGAQSSLDAATVAGGSFVVNKGAGSVHSHSHCRGAAPKPAAVAEPLNHPTSPCSALGSAMAAAPTGPHRWRRPGRSSSPDPGRRDSWSGGCLGKPCQCRPCHRVLERRGTESAASGWGARFRQRITGCHCAARAAARALGGCGGATWRTAWRLCGGRGLCWAQHGGGG